MTTKLQPSRQVELRSSPAHRKFDGSFFTSSDVAEWLAGRAIVSALVNRTGSSDQQQQIASMLTRNVPALRGFKTMLSDGISPSEKRTWQAALQQLTVIDPSCGAGAFLHASMTVLQECAELLGAPRSLVSPAQLSGIDIDSGAVELCRQRFAGAAIVLGDACLASTWQQVGEHDVCVGNPPFVRSKPEMVSNDLRTRDVANRAAWIAERAIDHVAEGGSFAFVMPISYASADSFTPLRHHVHGSCKNVFLAHFDAVPDALFSDAVQRITLVEANGITCRSEQQINTARIMTTKYHRWKRNERAELLERIEFTELYVPPAAAHCAVTKIGSPLEHKLLHTIFDHPPISRLLVGGPNSIERGNVVWYKRRWSYYLFFSNKIPLMWNSKGEPREPTECKRLIIDSRVPASAIVATLSSTLFWWYFSVFTDNRNVNKRDINAFPLPMLAQADIDELAKLGDRLLIALESSAEVRTCNYQSIGTIYNTYYRQGMTRDIIDEVDRCLARIYRFDDTMLEFLLQFERRFRAPIAPVSLGKASNQNID